MSPMRRVPQYDLLAQREYHQRELAHAEAQSAGSLIAYRQTRVRGLPGVESRAGISIRAAPRHRAVTEDSLRDRRCDRPSLAHRAAVVKRQSQGRARAVMA